MKTSRHITVFLMITALLVSGLPHFAAEDMDRDSRIGLKDAILSVREFVRSAAEPGKFAEKTGNTLSTLQAGAGLKTVIQKADDKNFSPPNPHFLLSFLFFLLYCFYTDFCFATLWGINREYMNYERVYCKNKGYSWRKAPD